MACFQMTVLGDGGTPEHGRCNYLSECAVKNCVYANKNMRINVAPCAASCINGKDSNDVTVILVQPGLPDAVKASLSPGAEKEYEVGPISGLSVVCGTPTSSSYLKFFNDRNQLQFEVRIDFGCANCLI